MSIRSGVSPRQRTGGRQGELGRASVPRGPSGPTALRELLGTMTAERRDIAQEMQIGMRSLRVTPRKMIVQAVTHELRH
ncbi:MAG: hypothetical protein M3Y27_14120 [Acidobacteriota bacterium]|nr:hypothetical protein [Acidobacteriota bacterium]